MKKIFKEMDSHFLLIVTTGIISGLFFNVGTYSVGIVLAVISGGTIISLIRKIRKNGSKV
jgi:hypothetical protein